MVMVEVSGRDSFPKILERRRVIEEELGAPLLVPDKRIALAREHAKLIPVTEAIERLQTLEQERAEVEAMLSPSADSDPAVIALVEEERTRLDAALGETATVLRDLLAPVDEADARDVFLEIRAGTGGGEAALFAGDLFRMYQRYAQERGWKFEIVSMSENDLGGLREGIATVVGRGAYGRLRNESGVHRVQRVPETEASGRIHTSAATVAVLPRAEEIDVDISPQDLRIDTFRAQGAGGQHVNKTDSAVRITHEPSGIVAVCQDEKSQHRNRIRAMEILRSRIYEREYKQREDERARTRRSQVGSGDRSERVRTYNFPQDRITDHRINHTLHRIEQVLSGERLDELVDALLVEERRERLEGGE